MIAIISLLASLLAPTLQTSREKSRRAACGNNLRQLALAIQSYVGDHDGVYPSYDTFSRLSSNPNLPDLWYQKLDTQYLGDHKGNVWRCPANPEHEFHYHRLSYGYNVNVGYYRTLDDPISQVVQLSAVVRPSQIVLLADGDNRQPTYRSYLNGQWRDVGLIHNEGANIAWLDGHVEWRLQSEVSSSTDGWTDEMLAIWGRLGWYAR